MRRVGLLFLLFCWGIFAQQFRLGFIDSEYIYKQIPEYAKLQEKIILLDQEWKENLQNMNQDIAVLKQAYEADKILLSAPMRSQREQEIAEKEQEMQRYKTQKFGIDGQLMKMQEELMQPLQDLLFDTVQRLMEDEKYNLIVDIAKNNGIFVNQKANKQVNISDYVLKKMGYGTAKK